MADTNETTGEDKAYAAYVAFEEWLETQSDQVQDMTLLEQIDIYANAE